MMRVYKNNLDKVLTVEENPAIDSLLNRRDYKSGALFAYLLERTSSSSFNKDHLGLLSVDDVLNACHNDTMYSGLLPTFIEEGVVFSEGEGRII